ncbi:MAG: phenylacetic acid degradation protein PaaN [Sterolibacteriaceae bacterium MAG5]|nr:phenylacetic acid degradation protein PaaN [Candidatus Nitricoxidireducens bremensis]
MAHPMFVKHQDLLASAVHALESRGYWSPYAESPKAYGENAIEEGSKAFVAYQDAQFYLDQPGVVGRGGGEVSPYGFPLNVSYPKCSPDALIAAGKAAMPAWMKAGPDVRAGVCAEILARFNAHSMEIAHAVIHTTGQAFMMAFQAGGPHAQDRGLEAVALAWREMKQIPYHAVWEKPQGKAPPLRMEKRYTVVPRGVALVVACSTFPTWNGYPGLFASLVTGNAVIVKPHPSAILPLAISVAIARQTLKEAGFDPNLVSLLVDTAEAPITKDVALKPDIRLIDYTGGPDFGQWLEDSARQALVFSEKAGVNCIVIDSTDNYAGLLRNLSFTLCLYSGQMCTTPQTLFLPQDGLLTPEGPVGFDQFCRDLANSIGKFVEDPGRAVEVLGAIQSTATLDRLLGAESLGEVIRPSAALVHPLWPEARIRTPLLLKAPVADSEAWMEERFGPISFVVQTVTTAESIAVAERTIREKGAITFSVYSTNDNVLELAEETSLRAGVALSINLTGGVFVNQSAGFSDFHATGANPAANASLTDAAFVASRFFVVQSRRHIP